MSHTTGKTALITGISTGLGHGLAQALLDDGWHVLGCARRTPDFGDLDANTRARLRFRSIDLSRLDTLADAVQSWLGETSRIDLVILNAGILGPFQDLRDTAFAQIQSVMDVNVWANKILIDTLAGRAQLRQVIAISSGAAISGNRGWNSYAISKAALNMLIQLYARELPGTHFTALAPGLVETDMQVFARSLSDVDKFPDLQRLRSAHGTPLMPPPLEAARNFLSRLEQYRALPSGGYADIRKL